jgi:hypothetical protein
VLRTSFRRGRPTFRFNPTDARNVPSCGPDDRAIAVRAVTDRSLVYGYPRDAREVTMPAGKSDYSIAKNHVTNGLFERCQSFKIRLSAKAGPEASVTSRVLVSCTLHRRVYVLLR